MLNVLGFFDPLIAPIDEATRQRFVRPEHRDMLIIEPDPSILLDRLGAWEPVIVDK